MLDPKYRTVFGITHVYGVSSINKILDGVLVPPEKSTPSLVTGFEFRGVGTTRESTCRAASDRAWDVAASSHVADFGPGYLAGGRVDTALPVAILCVSWEVIAEDHDRRGEDDDGGAENLHFE